MIHTQSQMRGITIMDYREFILASTVLLGCSVLAVGCSDGGGSNPADVSVDEFSLPDLSKHRWVDIATTDFSVTHSIYGAIDMEMTAIDDDIYTPKSEQFSVTFRGPELPLLEEGVYQVYNDTFGYIELYLQPATSAPGNQFYRAVFSILQV